MKTIMAKSHPSVGKEDPPRNRAISTDFGWSKKKGDSITIQALSYIVNDCTGGSMQKGKITLFKGGWFSSIYHSPGSNVKQVLLRRQHVQQYKFGYN